MNDINTLDLKVFISNAMRDIFDRMFSMDLALSDGGLQEAEKGNGIVGSVSFTGDVMGSVNIMVHDIFARLMTAQMLDMEVNEIDDHEDVYDVIGELCNMVGGDLKSRLCDHGFPCRLSIPSIVIGNNIKIESKGWSRKERFGFKHREQTALVEVYLKSSE
jgi:CheY-specific phosphatase CheX